MSHYFGFKENQEYPFGKNTQKEKTYKQNVRDYINQEFLDEYIYLIKKSHLQV